MEKKELLDAERKNLFEKAPDFRTQETMTFELDVTKSEKFTKVIIKTSPYSEKLAKAIKGYDDFILLQDHHYGYTESALGWIKKYADDEPPTLIGMLKFYDNDTFFVNGKEVWIQDFIMALKFDAQIPVSYCDF